MDGIFVRRVGVISFCLSDLDDLLDLEDFDDFLDDFLEDFFINREYDPLLDGFVGEEMEASFDVFRSMEEDAVVVLIIVRRINVEMTNVALIFLVTVIVFLELFIVLIGNLFCFSAVICCCRCFVFDFSAV